MLKANPVIHTKPNKSLKSFRERTSISDEQDHDVGTVENLNKNLALSAISKTTSHLITGASRQLLQVMNRPVEKGLKGVVR